MPAGFGSRTPEQIQAALEAARTARTESAAILKDIRSGAVTLADVLSADFDRAERAGRCGSRRCCGRCPRVGASYRGQGDGRDRDRGRTEGRRPGLAAEAGTAGAFQVRIWTLTHSRDGTAVSLTEVPFWAWAAQELGEGFCVLSEKTAGFSPISPPQWMFALRWGRLDADGYTERSAGHVVWKFGQALCSGFGAYHREKDIDHLPVTGEWVREHQPGAGWPWDGSEAGD